GGDAEGEETEDGKSVERPAGARLVGDEREGAGGGHEAIVDRDVMAARTAESRHVPRVDDADRGGRKEHQAVVGHAARQEPGLPAGEHDAPAHEPGAVLAAARKWPAAGYPIAAVDHRRLAERCEGAAAHDLRVAAVDLPRRLLGEVGAR